MHKHAHLENKRNQKTFVQHSYIAHLKLTIFDSKSGLIKRFSSITILTKDTPYLALTDELWHVYCDYLPL